MKKLDATVKKETMYIAASVLVLSAVTQLVFILIRRWDITVLLGNLLGGCAAVVNFLLMGMTVQNAVTKDEKQARDFVKLSQTVRLGGTLIIAVIGVAVPCFNTITSLLPLFFPRIAIMFRPLFKKI